MIRWAQCQSLKTVLSQSTGNNPSSRYADYSHLTLDPTDNETFWFISENFKPQLHDVVGVFKLAPEAIKDVQVGEIILPSDATLTDTEAVKIKIRNAGIRTQGDFDVSYRIDDGPNVTERFSGSLAFNETAEYTFNKTADLSQVGKTYQITASTALIDDQNPENDTETKNVKHIPSRDVGIAKILQPITKGGQTTTEPVQVTIANYGGQPQSDIPVYFSVNGGALANGVALGIIEPGATADYTFDQTADLSLLGAYSILAGTALPQDAIAANDTLTETVSNFYCAPGSNCKNYNDGVTQIDFAGQGVETICSPEGYVDDTETVFTLDITDGLAQVGTLQMGYKNSVFVIFVDFNNNGAFEASEKVSSGSVATGNTDVPFTLKLPDNVALGEYRMRVRGKDSQENGDLNNACGFLDFGRTTDFTLRIIDPAFVQGVRLEEGKLVVFSKENDQFSILLRDTDYKEDMILNVFALSGQKLVENRIEKTSGNYIYDLDMSYAAPGVYIVRIGTKKDGLVKKILVR